MSSLTSASYNIFFLYCDLFAVKKSDNISKNVLRISALRTNFSDFGKNLSALCRYLKQSFDFSTITKSFTKILPSKKQINKLQMPDLQLKSEAETNDPTRVRTSVGQVQSKQPSDSAIGPTAAADGNELATCIYPEII